MTDARLVPDASRVPVRGGDAAPDTTARADAGGGGSMPPRARARRPRWVRLFITGLVALAVVLLAGVLWFVFEANPIGGPGAPAVFEVTPGEPFSQVAGTLAAKGIIGSSLALRLDFLVTGTPSVQPGWYELPTNSPFSHVRAVLSGGPNASAVVVTTAESSLEVAQDLAGIVSASFAQGFLSDVRNGVVASPFQAAPHGSLEGLLSPGTYVLVPNEPPATLVTQMAGQFVHRAATVGLTATTTYRGLDANQLITVASIVEKEGYLAANMPKVATVVYNRLAGGTPLQMDSTVEYAIGQDGGPVTHATEAIKSPYNTYLHTGLTPTPICIPSTQALDATLHPPTGPWLYFETINNDGAMAFASTFAEQLHNEQIAAANGVP
jgi:UPF0755 protein